MGAGKRTEVIDHAVFGPALAIGAIREEGVPDVDDGKKPGRDRNLLTSQAAGVASAVPLFMVRVRNVDGGTEIWNRREQVIGVVGCLRIISHSS